MRSRRSIIPSSYDYYVLAAAATGATINRADDSEELKTMLLFGGGIMAAPTAFKATKGLVWDLPKWGYQNYGNYRNAFNSVWNNTIGQTNLYASSASRQMISQKGFWDTVHYNEQMAKIRSMNVPNHNFGQIRTMDRAVRAQAAKLQEAQGGNLLQQAKNNAAIRANEKAATTVKNSYVEYNSYKKVNQLIKEAEGLTGKRLAAKMRQIDRALVKAKVKINDLKGKNQIVSTTKVGKACSWVKTKTGLRTLESKVLQGTVSKNAAVRGASKCVKGGGAMIAISAALEAPTVYKTFRDLGAKKGFKQLGKSAVRIGAETVGWIAGAKIGGIAGAKIGGTIGTCIGGPIGTAIGGAIGAIIGIGCGLLGSWLCGKAAKAVVGEDELELAKKKEATKLALKAQNDTATQAELLSTAEAKVNEGQIATEKDLLSLERSYTKLTNKLQKELDTGKITLADLGIEEEQYQQYQKSQQYQKYQQYQRYPQPNNYVEVINEPAYVDDGLLALNSLATGSSTNSGYNSSYPTNTFFKYSIAA